MAKKNEKTFLDKISLDFSKIIVGNIILNVLFLILGLVLFLNSSFSLNVIGVMIGVYVMLFGVFAIYEFLMRKDMPLFSFNIVLGILAIAVGIFTIVNPFKIIKIMTLGLGIYLSIAAIFKIIEALKLKKYGFDGWLVMLSVSALLLILGIVIAVNPMAAMDIAEAAGLFIILASILEISNLILMFTKAKDIKKLIMK